METPQTRTETAVRADDGVLEVRFYDQPSVSHYRSWRMPLEEAMDLAHWWLAHGANLAPHQLPVHVRAGCVAVSMTSINGIEVRGFDRHGRPKWLGASFPREVVEALVSRLGKRGHLTDSAPGVPAACSNESS